MTKLVKNLIVVGTGTTVVAGTATGISAQVAHKNKVSNLDKPIVKKQSQTIAQRELADVEAEIASFDAERNAEFHQSELNRVESQVRKYVLKQNAKAAQEALAKTEADVASFVAERNAQYQASVKAEVEAWVAQHNAAYQQSQLEALKVRYALDHKKEEIRREASVQEAIEVTKEVAREDMIDTALAALENKLNTLAAEHSVALIDKMAQAKLADAQIIAQQELDAKRHALRVTVADKREALFLKGYAELQERKAQAEVIEAEFLKETARIQEALNVREILGDKKESSREINSEDMTREAVASSSSKAETAAKTIAIFREQLVKTVLLNNNSVKHQNDVLNSYDVETSTTSDLTEIVDAFHNAITLSNGFAAMEKDEASSPARLSAVQRQQDLKNQKTELAKAHTAAILEAEKQADLEKEKEMVAMAHDLDAQRSRMNAELRHGDLKNQKTELAKAHTAAILEAEKQADLEKEKEMVAMAHDLDAQRSRMNAELRHGDLKNQKTELAKAHTAAILEAEKQADLEKEKEMVAMAHDLDAQRSRMNAELRHGDLKNQKTELARMHTAAINAIYAIPAQPIVFASDFNKDHMSPRPFFVGEQKPVVYAIPSEPVVFSGTSAQLKDFEMPRPEFTGASMQTDFEKAEIDSMQAQAIYALEEANNLKQDIEMKIENLKMQIAVLTSSDTANWNYWKISEAHRQVSNLLEELSHVQA